VAKAIVTYCDVCLTDDDVYTEGTATPEFTIGRGKQKTLDLCDEHRKQYVTPFEELLSRLGTFVDKQRPPIAAANSTSALSPREQTQQSKRASTDKDETCPLCEKTYLRASGAEHFRQVHPGKSRAHVLHEHGLIDEVFECDERGCDLAFTAAQGLLMHRTRAHGYRAA